MRSYLPLNALRAFESAARHLSFSRAADELCVTPTAISHQVRSLEEFLEATLFDRRNGRLSLTAAASTALSDLSDGFNKLEAAISPLSRRGGRQKVTVAASPSFASLWLLPRLQRFCRTAPDIDVSISTVIAPAEFGEGSFDVSICSSDEHPKRRVEHLMDEQVLPVCRPDLLCDADGDRHLALTTLPLIHDDKADERFPTWQRFFTQMQVTGRDPTGGLRFNQSSLATEAALQGHGMLLGRSRLIEKARAEGRLVAVIEEAVPAECHYFTVRKLGAAPKPVRAFMDWLTEEANSPAPVSKPVSRLDDVRVLCRPEQRRRLAALDRTRKKDVVRQQG